MIGLFRRYWRRVGAGLLVAWALLPLVKGWDELPEVAIRLFFFGSQVFWIRRMGALAGKLVTGRKWRVVLGGSGLLIYLVLLRYNLRNWENVSLGSTLSLRAALLEAPMRLWLFGSLLGFLLIVALWIVAGAFRTIRWGVGKLGAVHAPAPFSASRRRLLGRAAVGVAAAPFFAGTYGLFYGRLNLETTHHRIALPRLPKAFDGFRIVQLSDLHISAFMPAEQIRRYVAIANDLKPDLVALTGDFLTWDEHAQSAIVEVLSALRAPFGTFGCLGNHEWLTGTEDSITRLFASRGTRILRHERAAISTGGSTINLVGVDYESLRGRTEAPGHPVDQYLPGIERLLVPDMPNILLSHNPNSFDRAADLGIDLTLAGHTHGGQVTLDFIDPRLSPGRPFTQYVRGHYQQRNSQVYVNCGIGTIGFPIRLGARPEITVLELTGSPLRTRSAP